MEKELVFTGMGEQAVTSSLLIAEKFGKRHGDIIHRIEAIEKEVTNFSVTPMFERSTYVHAQNNMTLPIYFMNRDGFILTVMGMTGKKALQFKLAYINAFNKMEKTLRTLRIEEYQKQIDEMKSSQVRLYSTLLANIQECRKQIEVMQNKNEDAKPAPKKRKASRIRKETLPPMLSQIPSAKKAHQELKPLFQDCDDATRIDLLRQYLDTPLPEYWYDYTIPQRLKYLSTPREIKRKGKYMRNRITIPEIMVECFHEPSVTHNAVLKDAYIRLLSDIPGWHRYGPLRVPGYGVSRKGYIRDE